MEGLKFVYTTGLLLALLVYPVFSHDFINPHRVQREAPPAKDFNEGYQAQYQEHITDTMKVQETEAPSAKDFNEEYQAQYQEHITDIMKVQETETPPAKDLKNEYLAFLDMVEVQEIPEPSRSEFARLQKEFLRYQEHITDLMKVQETPPAKDFNEGYQAQYQEHITDIMKLQETEAPSAKDFNEGYQAQYQGHITDVMKVQETEAPPENLNEYLALLDMVEVQEIPKPSQNKFTRLQKEFLRYQEHITDLMKVQETEAPSAKDFNVGYQAQYQGHITDIMKVQETEAPPAKDLKNEYLALLDMVEVQEIPEPSQSKFARLQKEFLRYQEHITDIMKALETPGP